MALSPQQSFTFPTSRANKKLMGAMATVTISAMRKRVGFTVTLPLMRKEKKLINITGTVKNRIRKIKSNIS
jgi:hypothetical protein